MPPDTPDIDALTDLLTPWCILVAVTLKMPSRVARGVNEIRALAAEAECDAEALHNVMAHLVRRGVFVEVAPGRFELNDAAEALSAPEHQVGLDLNGIGGRMAHAWGTLFDYVRTGKSAYKARFGLPFWEDLDANSEIGESFDALMGPAGHGVPSADIPIANGWSEVRTVVDVGGGTGAMLAAILKAHPSVNGILVDLPRAVANSAETFRDAGVNRRVRAVAQSFFDPLPAGGDLYLLKKVLNDWPNDEATAILSRCAEAAKPRGTILVMGGVSGDAGFHGISIDMLVAGGRSRSTREFRSMARRAGLDIIAETSEASGGVVVECRPR